MLRSHIMISTINDVKQILTAISFQPDPLYPCPGFMIGAPDRLADPDLGSLVENQNADHHWFRVRSVMDAELLAAGARDRRGFGFSKGWFPSSSYRDHWRFGPNTPNSLQKSDLIHPRLQHPPPSPPPPPPETAARRLEPPSATVATAQRVDPSPCQPGRSRRRSESSFPY